MAATRRGDAENFVLQCVSGVAKLRVAGAGERAFGLWAARFAAQQLALLSARRWRATQAAVATLLLPAGLAALFAAAGSLLRPAGPSALHLGGWVAFRAAFGRLSAGLAGLVGAATRMLAVLPAYERARPILQAPPECVTQPGGAPLVLQGAIEFTSVTFAYDPDTPPVLQDLTLSIQRSVSRLDPTEAVLAEGFLGFLRGEGAGSEGRVYR